MNETEEDGMNFKSAVFQTETIELADTQETIVRGGRNKFPLLPQAFGYKGQIGIIGWGSQAPAQAMNLRDSLAGMPINVKVGLRQGSGSYEAAWNAGFREATNTLGEMFKVISESDIVSLLISDAAQVQHYKQIFAAMKPGATLVLSHGFLLGHLNSVGETFPDCINVIGVCPKGMGPSVRRLYEQGKEIDGAGINCSIAVERDLDGRATDQAIGWATAIGAPFVFGTTLKQEYLSDLVGERGILLGGVWGIVEAAYNRHTSTGMWRPETAFRKTVENVTGPISRIISRHGIAGLYETFTARDKEVFDRAYASIYTYAYDLLAEIYAEVASGREINEVVEAGSLGMSKIGNGQMWHVGEKVRSQRANGVELMPDPLMAGLYVGAMMAQVDLLQEMGHKWSEICNESVIEAVDSLNPYMHHKGVAHMIDNCSTTARRGARKWGPRFEDLTYVALDDYYYNRQGETDKHRQKLRQHPVHGALAKCALMRPPVDIALA